MKSSPPACWPVDRWAALPGRRLRYWDVGSEAPTIVAEAGLGSTVADWARLVAGLSERGRVICYDRAGLGASDPDPAERSAGRMVEDLGALLRQTGAPPPYLLVAHSWGGVVARLFAHRAPDQVCGLVLVDVTHEAALSPAHLRRQRTSYLLMHWLARGHLLWPLMKRSPLLNPYEECERAYLKSALSQLVATSRREVKAMPQSQRELAAALASQPRLSCPVIAISASTAERPELHAQLIEQGTGGYHTVAAGAGHHVHLEQPELVLGAIDHILRAQPANG